MGFGRAFSWDTDLLSGYRWEHLRNNASSPSLNNFFGTRLKSIGNKLKALSPSMVLVTGWHQLSLVQVAVASKKAGIPCLVRGESNNLKPRGIHLRILHRLFLKLFSGYLYIGEANRQFYLGNGATPNRMHFSPYFVDNAWFGTQNDHSGLTRERWHSKFNISPSECVILFAGKLQRKKNVAELIQAIGMIHSSRQQPCLVITGDGDLKDQLRQLADRLGVRVVFTGFINQSRMPEVYASADCCVLPSDYGETWGLVINEAMNFGLPVVVSDRVGCGQDLVREGVTGYRYRFGHPEQLADVLQKLCDDTVKRRKLGSGARARIQRYSIEAATAGLLEAIDATLDPTLSK